MISLHEARILIAEKIGALPAEPTLLGNALGGLLRGEVRAPGDMPGFDCSAMDGYAIGADDDSEQFRIVGEIQPGTVPEFTLHRGECARIFTGAQIPSGASQVLMQEDAAVSGGIMIPQRRGGVSHIRRRGTEARRGDLLLADGTRLGPAELALLAGLGVIRPAVTRACRVAHFVSGNELVDPACDPVPPQIRDSNSTLVAALVRAFGGEPVLRERVPDDFDWFLERARAVPEEAFDLLLISGGASAGTYDFGARVLSALGFEIHFTKLNLRPGKPLVFATRGTQAAFVVPGNPVSHFVTLHLAVKLALERFAGARATWPLARARLREAPDYRPDPRETFWPARVSLEGGGLSARMLPWHSSGDIAGIAGANALVQIDAGAELPKAGDPVHTLLLELP
jgi:molybdopterin molybdotransferase